MSLGKCFFLKQYYTDNDLIVLPHPYYDYNSDDEPLVDVFWFYFAASLPTEELNFWEVPVSYKPTLVHPPMEVLLKVFLDLCSCWVFQHSTVQTFGNPLIWPFPCCSLDHLCWSKDRGLLMEIATHLNTFLSSNCTNPVSPLTILPYDFITLIPNWRLVVCHAPTEHQPQQNRRCPYKWWPLWSLTHTGRATNWYIYPFFLPRLIMICVHYWL